MTASGLPTSSGGPPAGTPPSSGPPPVAPAKKDWSDPDVLLDQWNKYEQIAMHFNDLLMRFRTQALAGFAAVGGLAAVFANIKGSATVVLPVVLCVLCVFWIAAWILDQRYYSVLLRAAVEEIVKLEATTNGKIRMSTGISAAAPDWKKWVIWFYGVVLFGLSSVTTAAMISYVCHRNDNPSPTAVTGTIEVRTTAATGGSVPAAAAQKVLGPGKNKPNGGSAAGGSTVTPPRE